MIEVRNLSAMHGCSPAGNTEIYVTKKMNDDNAAGCAAALLIMMLFGLGLLIWVVIEAAGFTERFSIWITI